MRVAGQNAVRGVPGKPMIPLRDNIRSEITPVVNYALIIVCAIAFLIQLTDQHDGRDELIERYGMIPVRVLHPDRPVVVQERQYVQTDFGPRIEITEHEAASPKFPPWMNLLTCIFLHGGWLHLIGNMWFLYIFGDNVEGRLGHLGYLIFYLGCGIAASALHLVTNLSSDMPTIGASGAIAGVMGAYLLLYPRARVSTLVPIVFFITVISIPAPIFLGFWFLLQFYQGTLAIGEVQSEGVAWWAHVGGFLAGALIAYRLKASRRAPPVVEVVRSRF